MSNDLMGDSVFDDKIIIVDKPYKHTSSEITAYIRKLFNVSKAGHAGTLDPDTTGVLPIALGRATKLLGYVSKSTKVYVCLARFGMDITEEKVKQVFSRFIGSITQTPPEMSAVRKVPRKRRIYYIKLVEFSPPFVLFETKVEAGTYIRVLCKDMGKFLGNGDMVELRRIRLGNIKEDAAYTLHRISEAIWAYKNNHDMNILNMLISPEHLIDFPIIKIKETALHSVCSGAFIARPGIVDISSIANVRRGDLVKIYCNGSFVGIGKALVDSERMHASPKAICFKMERVHYRGNRNYM